MSATTVIRPAQTADAGAIATIYNGYISETHITFEIESVAADAMASRIDEVTAIPLPWLVAEVSRDVVGYAYATPWKDRPAYKFSVETAIYLDPKKTGMGIGRMLYSRLLNELATMSLHSAIGGIALPNAASVQLHEQLGFRKIGQFDEVGFKHGHWIDVGYWQLHF